MNMCQEHWDTLKAAIEARGLMQLVAAGGKELVDHLVREVEGKATVVDFEPLMGSASNLFRLAMGVTGGRAMTPNAEGKMPCPVCLLRDFDYVAAAADGALSEAESRGLIPKEGSNG